MLQGQKVVLRRKRLGDARTDHAWRQDEELARLDAAPVLSLSYQDYLNIYRDEYLSAPETDVVLGSRRRVRFAIDTLDGLHIGNITLYDIDLTRRQAEMGIMIGDKRYWSHGYGTDAICTFLHHVFTQSDLERVYLHTLQWNTRAQRSFEKCGFQHCKRMQEGRHHFLEMEVWRQDFLAREASNALESQVASGESEIGSSK